MPKRIELRSLKQAAQRMPELIKKDARGLVAAFAGVALGDLAKAAVAKTPHGPAEDAARRVVSGGSAAYGHMRGRWFFTKARGGGGGKIPAGVGIAPPFKLSGDAHRLVNDAAHARVIEMGWQMSKPYARETKESLKTKRRGHRRKGVSIQRGKEFTRQLGSPAAPNGVLAPAISQLVATLDRIRGRAIQKAERR